MQLRAFAKINLDLRILGKRTDGFHELRTIFQSIDWFDEIEIQPCTYFEFSTNQGPQDETNLVVRAVRLFESVSNLTANVAVRLTKHIPTGAGLGGGSSDAATTFMGLQRFYGRRLTRDAVRALGSDVSFFMSGGQALGTGRGDEIRELDDRTDYFLVLVDPGFPIVTAEAYSWLTLGPKSNKIEGFCTESAIGSQAADGVNDFESHVFARYPQLGVIRDELRHIGAFKAALSGSGSTVFGQFKTEEKAREAATALNRRFSAKVAKPLSRAQYFSRMFV